MFYAATRRHSNNPQLRSVDQAVERFLASAFPPAIRHTTAQAPRVTHDDQAISLTVDVPGLTRDQIAITIDGNIVRLESVKDAPRALKLVYELAHDIEIDASEAKLENGVLTMKLARKQVVQSAKTLNIS